MTSRSLSAFSDASNSSNCYLAQPMDSLTISQNKRKSVNTTYLIKDFMQFPIFYRMAIIGGCIQLIMILFASLQLPLSMEKKPPFYSGDYGFSYISQKPKIVLFLIEPLAILLFTVLVYITITQGLFGYNVIGFALVYRPDFLPNLNQFIESNREAYEQFSPVIRGLVPAINVVCIITNNIYEYEEIDEVAEQKRITRQRKQQEGMNPPTLSFPEISTQDNTVITPPPVSDLTDEFRNGRL